MTLTILDVKELANLAYLELTDLQINENLEKLNSIFMLIQQIETINTTDVHFEHCSVTTLNNSLSLFLRNDVVVQKNFFKACQKLAPNTLDHLYLVPKIIE